MNCMKASKHPLRFVVSGGGTGGHIFPAISIANAIREIHPDADILFVGAENRMEMTKVPKAGYPIEGLPIMGISRKHLLSNFKVPFKLLLSLLKARRIIKKHRPDAVIGVGGYASGPTLWMAQTLHIPTLIQEQNSYAGLTNKLLAKNARRICVAYPGMERFFPADKIKLLGNPVRQNYGALQTDKQEAYAYFGLDPEKKTILITGGSLGARTLNECVLQQWELITRNPDIQVLWQVGEYYYRSILQKTSSMSTQQVHCCDFIYRMDFAYAIADIIIARAGAGTISELCLVGKACILIPSPNVTEDHQTKNALSLVEREAAKMIPDDQAPQLAMPMAVELLRNHKERDSLSHRILSLGLPDAAHHIALEILSLIP